MIGEKYETFDVNLYVKELWVDEIVYIMWLREKAVIVANKNVGLPKEKEIIIYIGKCIYVMYF
jgi:hypothetical protein